MTRAPNSRAVLLGTLCLLLLTLCIVGYLALTRYVTAAAPPAEPGVDPAESANRRLYVLLAIMLVSILLILVFVIGAYLVIRVGRIVSEKPVGGKPTTYVDAWAGYRLTDEEIAAATGEAPDDRPPPDQPDDDDPASGRNA